jgi:hypothetical protein
LPNLLAGPVLNLSQPVRLLAHTRFSRHWKTKGHFAIDRSFP